MRLSIDELMMRVPRLRAYLKTPSPAWPEIVTAADWLRGEMGVSKSLWGEACMTMGRDRRRSASSRRNRPSISSLDAGRVFPRHGGEGQGRRAQPQPHDLGPAPRGRAETTAGGQGGPTCSG
jgi:replication initiation protein RepC